MEDKETGIPIEDNDDSRIQKRQKEQLRGGILGLPAVCQPCYCPLCKQGIILEIGDTWINLNKYKVKILDYGSEDVWLLYLDNNNKVAWKIKNFLQDYHWFSEKKDT